MTNKTTWYEFTEYEAPDGTVYSFDTTYRAVLGEMGYGMSPTETIAVRGVMQNGETVYGYRLNPRTIQLVMHVTGCTRDEYWTERARMIDALRPNRHDYGEFKMGKLIRTLRDGSKRAIDVILIDGPSFNAEPGRKWNEFSFTETLRFYAPDPTFYDPKLVSVQWTMSPDLTGYLSFPFTFDGTNMRFARSYFEQTTNVTYVGTWISYPKFEITGPVSVPTIYNSSTGHTIRLYKDVETSETVTIDLTYASKTVESSIYGNIIGTVEDTNDLNEFHLACSPEVSGGVNSITFSGDRIGSSTSFVMRYYKRYIGV